MKRIFYPMSRARAQLLLLAALGVLAISIAGLYFLISANLAIWVYWAYIAISFLIIGILIGISSCDIRRGISAINQLESLMSAPVLGIFPQNRTKNKLLDTESVRTLRNRIIHILKESVIAFTSSTTGEGKTTAICNLAYSLSKTDKKVLLIDGDMRNPSVHKFFSLTNTSGLSESLSGGLADIIKMESYEGLHILTAGARPEDPSLLLMNDRMDALLKAFSHEFDYILIDCPPLLPVTDALALSNRAKVVIVARYKYTKLSKLKQTIKLLDDSNAVLSGAILTDVNSKKVKRMVNHP